MNIVVVWSSPNKDGLTASAKESFLRGIRKTDSKIEEIHLNETKMEHCRACGRGWGLCSSAGKCVIKDDFEDIYSELTKADGVECLHSMEEALKHMGMRAYDRVPVIRFNKEYMLPALENAGEIYSIRVKDGFDMQY